MSVDARLIISNKYTVESIVRILKKQLEVDLLQVRLTETSPDYIVASFEYKGEKRQLNIFLHYNEGGFDCTSMQLGTWGHYEEILKTIGKSLGGFYSPRDTTEDNFELFPEPGQGNVKYLLEYGITGGKINGNKEEDFYNYVKNEYETDR